MTSKAHNLEDKARTKDVLIEEALNFNALLLSEETLSGLQNNRFTVPSPIQLKAIPIGKCGFDLIIKSKSGTGKTAVFSIIALELVNVKKSSVQVLILTPTREIAVQIQDVLRTIGSEFKGLKIESFIGGLPVDEDIKKLSKCHIAVGAPGRVKHLLQLGALNGDAIKLFVLDEADKLVNSEMKVDIDYISSKLPSNKQVIASSATYSNAVITYLDTIMSSPTLVEPNTNSPLLLGLKQFVSVVKSNLNVVHQLTIKNEELMRLLSQVTFSQCLVFTNIQFRAESISNILNRAGWKSMYISAAQNQPERMKVINMLKEGKCRILLSTDITARGIDASNIDLVINYDVPYEASTYLHRMGRAGRFGSHGICITIAAKGKDLIAYQKILGAIGGVNVPQLPNDGNLPNNLWNADCSSFTLIQAVFDDCKDKQEIASSIAHLKVERHNFKDKKSTRNKSNEQENKSEIGEGSVQAKSDINTSKEEVEALREYSDTDMPNAVEMLLDNIKRKEDNLKVKVPSIDAMSFLKDLASGSKVSEIDVSQTSSSSSEKNLLDNILTDMSISKKRKRQSFPIPDEAQTLNNQEIQSEKKHNSELIMCKNVALLNTSKLLCESYQTNQVVDDVVSSLDAHLRNIKNEKLDKIFESHTKDKILNLLTTAEEENIVQKLNSSDNDGDTSDNALCVDNLEDIFKLSFDYAIDSEKRHWSDILGKELEEKMSLTEKVPEEEPQILFNEIHETMQDLPRRRRYKSRKNKKFKDFTHRSKKNDVVYDQSMEAYDGQEMAEQVDPNYYYQAGLYSDYEYANNSQFTSCYDYYSTELTERVQTFEDVQSFEDWFTQWQWQVQGVRDYVQQNIYLQEMNKYTSSKH